MQKYSHFLKKSMLFLAVLCLFLTVFRSLLFPFLLFIYIFHCHYERHRQIFFQYFTLFYSELRRNF